MKNIWQVIDIVICDRVKQVVIMCDSMRYITCGDIWWFMLCDEMCYVTFDDRGCKVIWDGVWCMLPRGVIEMWKYVLMHVCWCVIYGAVWSVVLCDMYVIWYVMIDYMKFCVIYGGKWYGVLCNMYCMLCYMVLCSNMWGDTW